MKKSEQIIKILKDADTWLSATEIMQQASIKYPSYASRLLNRLVSDKKILKKRSGRHILYRQNLENTLLETSLDLTSVEENQILAQAKLSPIYCEIIPEHIDTIASFAFTEMLNNAKDHSHSGIGYVKIWEENGILKFIVRDHGVGVFRNIQHSRHLKNEQEAIEDLIKGKVTTRPSHHSGEGIFWTSKMSDRFSLISYNYALHIDNTIKDYSIEKLPSEHSLLGTEVHFEIALSSTKSITEIFDKFSLNHTTYSFDTTEIPLKLYDSGDFWVSRSQAKRVLSGLEKYRKVIIDFAGINLIGQGFADEIFRVFNITHPNILLEPVNMSESVRMMVEKAKNDPTGRA